MLVLLAALLLVTTLRAAPAQTTSGAEADPRREDRSIGARITADEIRETIGVLADDSLEGREAGTAAAEQAARYIANRFGSIGLRPPAGGYLQYFDLPFLADPGGRNRLVFRTPDGVAPADTKKLSETGPADSLVAGEFTPLVFSATGAVSGPLKVVPGDAGRRDRSGLAGAIALVVAVPGEGLSQLRGRIEALADSGAAGALVLSDPLSIGFSHNTGRAPLAIPVLAVSYAGAERLARAAGLDLLALVHGATAEPSRPLDVALAADLTHVSGRTPNVVGILEGSDPTLRREAVVIGAHYDHLGWGGAGSLAAHERAIHNGADDNASGVAGVLELAERFAPSPPPRTLVFVAFGAEELGNVGSRHYMNLPAWPLERTVAMVNLDMIGRLRDERLTVYGTGTAAEWDAMLDSALSDAATVSRPLDLRRVPDGFGPSDHASFYAKRIPVLAFFTGPHGEYHRPTDDAATIDPAGEARVLELVAAVVEDAASTERRMTFVQAPATEQRPAPFRVALGTLPDYAFGGPGVRLAGVRPGGPAARAGLREGDVLLRLGGRDLEDVYGYTEALGALEAGEGVELVYARGSERRTLVIVPEAR